MSAWTGSWQHQRQAAELDELWVVVVMVVLPVLLGSGVALSPPGTGRLPLRLLRAGRTFPDGAAELVYTTRA